MASKSRVGEILLRAKVIDELQLRSALAQQDQWGGRIARMVVEMGLADEDTVTEAIAKATSTSRMRLGNLTRDPGALAKFDAQYAEQKGIFPVALKENGKLLVVAVADPTDLDLLDQLQMKSRTRVQPVIAGEREIERAINKYYRNVETPQPAAPSRRPAAEPTGGDDEEEFKIVDMSGNTVVKRIADILPPEEARKLEAAQGPSESSSSAGDLLDQILSGGAAVTAAFTPEEQQRLEAVQVNQEKSSKILRALLELLLEKSAFSQRELAAKMKA